MKKTIFMGICLLSIVVSCENTVEVNRKEVALQRFGNALRTASIGLKSILKGSDSSEDKGSSTRRKKVPFAEAEQAAMANIIGSLAGESLSLLSFYDITLSDIESLEYESRVTANGRLPSNIPEPTLTNVVIAGLTVYSLEAKLNASSDKDLYDCALRSIGIDAVIELAKGGFKKASKALIKKAIKKVIVRSLGYIGVAWAVYEFGDCMEWY